MKKLNLQLGSIKEMLTKEQMRKVTGGSGYFDHPPGNSIVQCFSWAGNYTPSLVRCPYSDTDPNDPACISYGETFFGVGNAGCGLGSCHGRGGHTCG